MFCGKLDDAKALGVGEEKSMLAFRHYVERHTEAAKKEYEVAASDDRERLLEIAECCEAISFAPPATFRQALQLVWFILSFTEFEAACAAISLDTHYGSDSDESNRLATELSQFISDVI